VLVNIGTLDRRGLAMEIEAISKFKPRIIASDILFACSGGFRDTVNCEALKDVMGNVMLSNAIREAGNVILGSILLQTDSLAKFDTNESDSLEISDPEFDAYTKRGFVTLPTDATYQEDVKKVNSIFPSKMVAGKRELAFSVQIAMQYDSVKAKRFLARNNEEELINFRGNMEVLQLKTNSLKNADTGTTEFGTMFYTVDVDDIVNGNVLGDLFTDRIVMIGYLGDHLGDPAWEDKFFTPLNKKLAGRANPDMFGLVVHANAVAMILNEDYVGEIADWAKYAIAFVVCLLTVALFIWIDRKLPMWFDAFSVFIQVAELLIISLFIIYAFSWWSLKLDLTLALAVSALVGPAYDIFKSAQNEINRRITKRRERVLKPVEEAVR
jgi:CHASE2 domain-containing sensor protein